MNSVTCSSPLNITACRARLIRLSVVGASNLTGAHHFRGRRLLPLDHSGDHREGTIVSCILDTSAGLVVLVEASRPAVQQVVGQCWLRSYKNGVPLHRPSYSIIPFVANPPPSVGAHRERSLSGASRDFLTGDASDSIVVVLTTHSAGLLH
jgi:hypothetical protein